MMDGRQVALLISSMHDQQDGIGLLRQGVAAHDTRE
jgi:hypothetical protein